MLAKDWIRERALDLGYHDLGVARVPAADEPFHEGDQFAAWLAAGFGGDMGYLARTADKRQRPQLVLADARTAIVLVHRYPQNSVEPRDDEGRVASYARGRDYHNVLRPRLRKLLRACREEWPAHRFYGSVDTGPVLEKTWAARAGLGWIGKNTLLLHEQRGSQVLLAVAFTTLELEPDAPRVDQCGDCRLCLDACPTQAFPQPYVLDARRCVSYLTIELRTDIAEQLRAGIGDHVFGCDDCQDVCPWSRQPLAVLDPAFGAADTPLHESIESLLGLDDASFVLLTRARPLTRPGRVGLVRNACIVAGNSGDRAYRPALERLLDDPSDVIRTSAEWALRKLDD